MSERCCARLRLSLRQPKLKCSLKYSQDQLDIVAKDLSLKIITEKERSGYLNLIETLFKIEIKLAVQYQAQQEILIVFHLTALHHCLQCATAN